ncbi:MAG TPA: carboxypeptidase-like regulatory domain-containing protein [Kofleriaceae bacterium]|nr:carboxypeptidase-like regulatory domain-containing protein [Kofleriaceae bacterium]
MRGLWILAGVLAIGALSSCAGRPTGSDTRPTRPGGSSAGAGDSTTRADQRSGPAAPSAGSNDLVQGFFAASAGEVNGRVVDGDGHVVAHATVHLVGKQGERTVTTDEQGRFKTDIGEPTMVVVYGGPRVTGNVVTSQKVDGAEAIDVHEALPPATPAKPLSDPTVIPEYSREAKDSRVWVRAWLLLEVSDTGVVSRVKLLNPPGHGLDEIAIRHAFDLKFEPARNRVDKPTVSQVVWKLEWPAYSWLRTNHRYPRRWLPPNVTEVPCRGSSSSPDAIRDCSSPNMAAAITAPWLVLETR